MSTQVKNGIINPNFVTDEINIKLSSPTEDYSNKPEGEKEEENKRVQWGHGMEFLMSCIAMSVGLGNIWRFPFTAYQNGGGAFLIPYFIVLMVVGRPVYYLEMIIGQFSQRGNIKAYENLAPVFKGVGIGQMLGNICVSSYYSFLMAVTLFYFLNSFTSELPWTYCRSEWDSSLENKSCMSSVEKNLTSRNGSISSSELYFTQEVLKESLDISNGIGLPEWRLTLCLIASWAVTSFVSRKGVQSSGKASYFFALFPYVIMVTLLIRAVTLEGATNGMYYFIKTDWNKLLEAEVWYAAITQCFFSLNVGFGTLPMYSSFNNFRHNIRRDALIVTTLDTFTSLLSGITIFGILGNLAHELGVEPDQVINSGGTGLAFISYPDAIAKFQAVPWLFSILFFFMLYVLGIGSLIAAQSAINTVIHDQFPNLQVWKISLATAFGGFLLGLVYTTPGGQYMLTLVDYFGGTFVAFVFAIVETTGIAWIYGLDRFCSDVKFMLGTKVGIYWRLTWAVSTPFLLILIFIYFIVNIERLKYAGHDYPDSILSIGWIIFGIAMVQAVLWILYHLYQKRHLGLCKNLQNLFSHKNWKPEAKFVNEWRSFKEEELKKRSKVSWLKRKWYILIGKED